MLTHVTYPSEEHAQAAQTVAKFYSQNPDVEAVILYGSCARGRASRDSCLDIMVLVCPEVLSGRRNDFETQWNTFYQREKVFETLRKLGKYSHVDLDFIDGVFVPKPRGWTSGPDEFELEIGNTLVYSIPLWEKGDYLNQLKRKWLPYYSEELRQKRLFELRHYCVNNLDHIPPYVNRGLYFQAFNRLYDAFQEFLQALFISRRIYPISYDKWIKEQIEEILGMPELYGRLVSVLEIKHFESHEIAEKAEVVTQLLEKYVRE